MMTKTLAYAVAVALLAVVASGQETYDTQKQRCCDGEVFDKRRGEYCCGKDIYNTIENGCCGDRQIVDYPNDYDDSYGCCLNEAEDTYTSYDSLTERCCNGVVVSVDRLDTRAYYMCCGTELMDFTKQTCCGDEILDDSDIVGKVCCGGEMLDVEPGTSEQCCRDEMIDTDSKMCCTTSYYDQARQQSINLEAIQDKTDDEDECCGNAAYNSDKEICCSKYVDDNLIYYSVEKPEDLAEDEYAYCCGYDVLVSNRADDSQSCCYGNQNNDDVKYDTETERCCAGNVQPKDDDEDADNQYCCHTTAEFYDGETEMCTSAGVLPLGSDLSTKDDVCVSESKLKEIKLHKFAAI